MSGAAHSRCETALSPPRGPALSAGGHSASAATIGAVIITRDEARTLPACLASLSWCDEIVVLDCGSTDATVELARTAGARVEVTPDWPGFGPQKNRALQLARSDWVLSIDADERVDADLADEIRAAVSSGAEYVGYRMPRLSSFCGRYMRHGGWYPDRVLRLFRRDRGRFSDDIVHETVQCRGPIGDLRCDLRHESFHDFEQVLRKIDAYSTAGAVKLHARGRRGSLGRAVAHGAWTFVRGYVLRAGFLDGRMGLALALSNAHGTYYRYVKLWLLQRDASSR